ncbi:MAG: hypothetical protein UIB40_01210 [Paludibacteraceae bacterium]|nr:hypothetical protein [Paludibacteraceae bacterium]
MTRTDYTYAADSQLFARNPVCEICWRICMEMCEEWGGQINFDLLASMEVADRLCRRLINNTWTLCGIEYYYHWLESELGYSRPAITCATATVCLSLQLMEDAPQPLLQLGADMHGLLWGEGGELYANMRSAARQEDIYLSANHYGEIPPDPYAELKEENQLLAIENKQLREQIANMKKGSTAQTVIKVAGNYIDIHDNSHCTIYATEAPQATQEKPSEVSSQTSVGASDSVFCLLTDQCRKEGKTEIVEAELRSAAKESASKLIATININEALGYLDTKNMSSQALYNALNDYFGLKYTVRNFTKYRR